MQQYPTQNLFVATSSMHPFSVYLTCNAIHRKPTQNLFFSNYSGAFSKLLAYINSHIETMTFLAQYIIKIDLNANHAIC